MYRSANYLARTESAPILPITRPAVRVSDGKNLYDVG
jgi:hypothetical protein